MVSAARQPAGVHVFDDSLRLTQSDEGRFQAEIDRRWWIAEGPNGGFLSSLCLGALQQVVGRHPQPRSLSVHFPGRATEGKAELEVRLDKQGRTLTFASGRMWQSGKLLTTFQGSFAPATDENGFDDAPPPDVKAPEDLLEVGIPDAMIPEFSRHFDYRPASEFALFSGADRAEVLGWIRFKESRPIDALLIPTLADAFFPAVFMKLDSFASVPTLDLTVHFRKTLPLAPDWVLGRFRTTRSAEGFFEEDGEIWSRDGVLLAQSRQLALLRSV